MTQEASPGLTDRVDRLEAQVAQLTGTLLANADRLQHRRVAKTRPLNGQALEFSAARNRWEPGSGILDRNLSQVDVEKTTGEETLYSFTIPADTLGATGGFRMYVAGDMLVNVAGTLTLKVKLGSTTILTVSGMDFIDNASRYGWTMEAICINSATNAQQWFFRFGGTIGFRRFDQTQAVMGSAIGTSAEDTTTDLALTMTAQWTVNSASLSMRKETALLELLPDAA